MDDEVYASKYDKKYPSNDAEKIARMIKQASAGIYSWLPLGFKVLQKIEDIIHEEQARAGHIPMLMPTIQSADLWRESGRYDYYGQDMLRSKDRHDRDMLFTPTLRRHFVLELNAFGDLLLHVHCNGMDTYEMQIRHILKTAVVN